MTRTRIERREFLKAVGLGVAAAALRPGRLYAAAGGPAGAPKRPNIVWISAEDLSPTLGCYGDKYATTPNLDRFAAEAVRYEWAFTHAPVCAPARSGIITGMYPTTIGTSWMRCGGTPPPEARCFPEYLRAEGYYCTNNSKTDYQFSPPGSAWDESSGQAHWRKRRGKDQSFFAVFNLGVTHESSTRSFKPGQSFQHDPAKAPLPPYYPDTQLVRENVACLYDRVNQLDGQIQKVLDELAADGLAEDTIVFFWGDHGWGLTRGKRWVYDSGLRVPLMVRVPPKWRDWAGAGDAKGVAPGTVCQEFAQFLDFAPTVLSLGGVQVPPHMQGRAFLGPQKGKEPQYIFAARDRMDETYDCIRALRDKQYKYIRNFMPYLTRGQVINYMDQTPILKEMRRLHAEGKLKDGPQMQFFEPTKPVHELYDILADPHEVNNLAADPKHKDVLERMSQAMYQKLREIGDVGLIPEPDFDDMKGGGTASEPVFQPAEPAGDGTVSVTISCPTRGASITYQLIPAGAGGARGAAGETAPAGGQVVLRAADAAIRGTGAARSGQAITGYRGADTTLHWQADLPAGRHAVWLLQANNGAGGSQFELAIGDSKLSGQIQHTSGWDDYIYVRVGEVELAKAGPIAVVLTPTKQVEGRLGNVGGVVIGGAEPPAVPAAMAVQGAAGAKAGKAGRAAKADKGGSAAEAAPGAAWLVYGKPIALKPGEGLRAQAWRLGYKPSGTVAYRYGEKPAPAKPLPDEGATWREKLNQSGMIGRILDVKAFDGRWQEGVEAYLKALSDPAGPVRYWAVVGLHQAFKAAAPPQRVRDAVQALFQDPSPSVPTAAAEAIADWGDADRGLARLIEVLASPNEKATAFAAWALLHLGEKARPALPKIEAAAASGPRYPNAVLKRVVERLKKP